MLKRLLQSLRTAAPVPGTVVSRGEARPEHQALQAAKQAAAEGRRGEALTLAESAFLEFPRSSNVALLAAKLQLEADCPQLAEVRALAALRGDAPDIDACLLLAQARVALGRNDDAVLAMRQGEDLNPEDPGFWNESGLLHLRLGNLEMAAVRFRRAVALAPGFAAPWNNLAVLEQRRGALGAAVAHLRRATECEPLDGAAWSNLGLALRDAERLDEAIGALRHAATLRPGHAQTRINLATALLDDDRLDESAEEISTALEIDESLVTAHVALAQLRLRRGETAGAEASYRRALQIDGNSALAANGLAELQLRSRDFASGWDNYESRLVGNEFRSFPFPRWDGIGPHAGALLVCSEQGIGDMILFASCYADIAGDRRVVLETPPKLLRLFSRSFPWAKVVPFAEWGVPRWLDEVQPIEAALPAGSLMRLFRRSAESFPKREKYLEADPARVAYWRARLTDLPAASPSISVGISWRGGFSRTGGRARSVELEDLVPLLRVPGVRAVSLQYTPTAAGEVAEANRQHGLQIEHWQEAIDDYDETAALVAGLDLVITVCTAVAHLSGALGRPTWILAPATASWRYLADGEDLPWYPSARVFRKPHGSGWDVVVERVAEALAQRIGVSGGAKAMLRRDTALLSAAAQQQASPPEATRKAQETVRDRAIRLAREGHAREAMPVLDAALVEHPEDPLLHVAQARAYLTVGDREQAADSLTIALHIDPDFVEALWLSCEVNDALGLAHEAIVPLERIVALGAGGFAARTSLARLYYRAGRYSDAERAASAVLDESPDLPDALDVLGLARIGVEDYEGAIAPLERLLRVHPGATHAPHHLATALIHRGRFEESRRLLDWVLVREPNNHLARWNYAYIDLACRRFQSGWRSYEMRRHLPERKQITANLPRWHGEPLPGKTLLVLGEQGLGDQIMFASCLPDLLDRHTRVMLTAEARLVPLFRRSFPSVRVLDEAMVRASDIAEADAEVLVGSLPAIFRPDVSAFPRRNGYLCADGRRVAAWRERLQALGDGPKLGVSWRGGTALTRARLRSLSVADLAVLLKRCRARFVSLQYGEVEHDLRCLRQEHGIDLAHFPEVVPDYDETAALVEALDGVVSVCTAIVHLAGALGRPAFVLVPSVPEWRYGIEGDHMPWYPSVRLFRQANDEPWAEVIARLGSALRHPSN